MVSYHSGGWNGKVYVVLYRLRLANVVFSVDTDVEIDAVTDGGYGPRLAQDIPADVSITLRCLPLDFYLRPREQIPVDGKLRGFFRIPQGDGYLLFPPVLQAHGPGSCTGFGADPFPILNADVVTSRLMHYRGVCRPIGVALHQLFVGFIDYVGRTIELYYSDQLAYILKTQMIDNSIRRMLTMFLPSFRAMSVHSSAIIRQERVALFVGPDGAGKTTAVRLSADGQILSDDRNIIGCSDEETRVYGTPWGYHRDALASARLGGIFLLEWARDFELLPVRPREAIELIWNDNAKQWGPLPKPYNWDALSLLAASCRSVPTFRMRFPKSYIDWNEVDRAMR